MCGIAGIISLNNEQTNLPRLKAMGDALAHRGPDAEGFWRNTNATAGLAHRRLSILDLTDAASQPMHLHQYSIVYNGEIYNYEELRRQLLALGHHFKSSGDTEVLLTAYVHYGEECLQHIDGMFAFAIWDEKKQQLFCARDRFGEKPFYYHRSGDAFYFASEMKGLWAASIAKEIDAGMMARYLALGHVQNPSDSSQTFYRNIYSLPAGTFCTYTMATKKWNLQQYFTLKTTVNKRLALGDVSAITNSLLGRSVAACLRSDVDVGCSLSGGLDSSSIASFIKQFSSEEKKFKTYSAVFPGFYNDETKHIDEVCNFLQLQNIKVSPSADELINDIAKLVYHQEEPFTSSSIFAQYKVYETAAANGTKVLLDGQGADEVFAGYVKYLHWYLQELVSKGKLKRAHEVLSQFKENGQSINFGFSNIVAAFLPAHTAMALQRKEYRELLNSPFLNKELSDSFIGNLHGIEKPIVHHLNDMLHFNVMQMGLQELLRYADRNSMAHGVEVRLPFLDKQLVNFAFTLPSKYKLQDGFTKYILRNAMHGRLPNNIVWRKDKVGFETPQKDWMSSPKIEDYLHEGKKTLIGANYLRAGVLQQKHTPVNIHEPGNEAWRFMVAAELLKK